jgi:dTDP-4-dehydrorhamnose reductase
MSDRLAWITGAGGLIGSYLIRAAPQLAPGWRAVGLVRSQLDLTDFAAVRRAFREQRPQLVIHCAALSGTPECEADPGRARKVNLEATTVLAGLAEAIPFFFFSSDLVFDGRAGNYDEAAAPNPLSVYAEAKAAAEGAVLANPRHSVIRTSLNGGESPARNRAFNEQLRRAWQTGRRVTLFTDEFRSPIFAGVTARAVWELVAQDQPGLYHLAGSERLSRWEMGQQVAARWPQLHPQIEAGSLRDYGGPPRPPDTSLNCAKVQRLLSFPLPGLSDWLARHPDQLF